MKTKEEIKAFALSEDYAFECGAGFTAANDDETREGVADLIIRSSSYRLLSKEDVEFEYREMMDELNNGCEIYEFIVWNETQLAIAVY